MLSVNNISYTIGTRQILNKVSLDARAGELLVILGNNGAGKSTLLKAICNELKCTGTVHIDGKNAGEYTTEELALKRAVLKQHTQINMPFLVKEVVMMGRYPHFKRKETAYDHAVVKKAIEKAGITHLSEQNYLTLSGGEQQRVQLARVLAQVENTQADLTQYLLLDEPVSSLDISHQHNTLQLAKQFAEKGNVVIAVLHDLNLAAMYADKILLLRSGKVHSTGTPQEVLNNETISQTFGFPAYVQQHPHADCLMVCFGAQPQHPQQLKEKIPHRATVL
ncbi:MAG: heme ABC transporter ATP-binding protein [Bacteroidota bacterium]